MRYKAIFFDMDGLLVDTEPLSLKVSREILGPVGVDISTEWYVRENLGKGTSTFSLARGKGVTDEEIERLRERRGRRYAEALEHIVPIDGVKEVLETLYGQFKLAVVTSSREDNFDTIMRRTGLRHFFDFAITAEDVAHLKPHPEPYLAAVEKTGERKDYCVALEDSRKGVEAAKAAGLTCYAVPDALTKTHDFSIADKVLNSIREVPDLLL